MKTKIILERVEKKNKQVKRYLLLGSVSTAAFIAWTVMIKVIDVQRIGQNSTDIGFATINSWIHNFTGVNMILYEITDWLGIIPLFICIIFGGIGLEQLIKRRSIFLVDLDIILLGIYYVIVILGYLLFEKLPINYRPIIINGIMEVSYPSSTTLLVLSVMPTLNYQVNQRMKNAAAKKVILFMSSIFSIFMVVGRLISGVHWFSDIIGSIMLSAGVFCFYKAAVLMSYKKEEFGGVGWNFMKNFSNLEKTEE